MARSVQRAAEAWTYVLLADRALPIEDRTTFTLRPLTITEQAAALDDLVRTEFDEDGNRVVLRRARRQAIALAVTHIEAIDNFPAGAPKPWPEDRDSRRRYLEQLRLEDVVELGDEIWKRSSIDAAGPVKNFSPPERTSSSGGDSPATPSSTPAPDATKTPL